MYMCMYIQLLLTTTILVSVTVTIESRLVVIRSRQKHVVSSGRIFSGYYLEMHHLAWSRSQKNQYHNDYPIQVLPSTPPIS